MVTGYDKYCYAGTTTYTFTPDAGQCATTTTLTITVNATVTPTFTAVPDICQNAALLRHYRLHPTMVLPVHGHRQYSTATAGTTTYTFTPAAGQCATTTTLTITVNPTVTPTFTAVPDICSGCSSFLHYRLHPTMVLPVHGHRLSISTATAGTLLIHLLRMLVSVLLQPH